MGYIEMKTLIEIIKIIKETGGGEKPGRMELAKMNINSALQYLSLKNITIENVKLNLLLAMDKFNMGKTKRKDMPVINEPDIKAFQTRLKLGYIDINKPLAKETPTTNPFPDGLSDEMATKFMSNGLRDFSKPDDKVGVYIKSIPVNKLIPIQKQVYFDKSVDSIAKFGVEKTKQFLASTILITSSDNRIIDGHHRFLSSLIIDPKMHAKCLVVDLPIKVLLPLATAYGDAIGNKRNL